MEHKTYFIKTFGCQMNIRDSEIIAQSLEEHGYRQSKTIEGASLIIINTCSVRAKAEQKLFSLLGALRKHKANHPALQICVAGCVAQQEGQMIIQRMPHVNLVVGTQHIYELPSLLQRAAVMPTAVNLSDTYEIPRYVPRPVIDRHGDMSDQFARFVTIMQGCNNFCTYCVVPYTRGREVSRKAFDIIDEVSILVAAGIGEITLLGQNVNSYGTTNPVSEDGAPYSFARLLREVSVIPGLRRLRFTTSNPKDLPDELISCFAEIDNLCPQLHLPVQSGSDAVLRLMNRKYRVADYLDKVDRLCGVRPDLALTTDIIVGFPGERDEDFQQTMDLLERVRYHGSFSFKYSDRPGTAAATFDGKCDEGVKSERLQIFQKRQDEISLERNREYIGSIQEVLLEKVDSAEAFGRSPTNHIVHLESWPPQAQPGDILRVSITSAGQHSMKGRAIDDQERGRKTDR
ncbi:MAG: tRNA (N6-isopentenyl adenosine(37)-C2)-methylthiotransferase MiaB [Desulfofustis sp.]|nr:tRNA (N6-isopentenyl adenosine(37)-C2)-methylthiotransferase MiaB [Desulfofustis sp.]